MKIEKINERQIRCVLTKEDLENRKIRLSELVCGGEKARGLLRDMILRASRELGFSFNNNPLMIEAVPTGKDQLVLVITRVDDPGELDSRFKNLSLFNDSEMNDSGKTDLAKNDSNGQNVLSLTGADDVLNLLRELSKRLKERTQAGLSGQGKEGQPEEGQAKAEQIQEGQTDEPQEKAGQIKENQEKAGLITGPQTEEKKSRKKDQTACGKDCKVLEEEIYQYTRFYLFHNLENVLSASKCIPETYAGENVLYKNPEDGCFYLLVKKTDTDPEQFNRICNVLSEYSMPMDYFTGMDEFFREHMQVIVGEQAIQHLRGV